MLGCDIMPEQSPYDSAFYAQQKDGSYNSATIVIPHVLSLCQPQSVADFGCGVGTWLRVFIEKGISDATGIDGEYVRDELLVIPAQHFVRANLTQPIDLKRKFDLVVSLEVAEHIKGSSAACFVETLTKHGPIVLFSAAIPSQGGTFHVNEQWPGYWNELFKERGYTCVDCLRGVFWEDERIDWWYRQNMLLFVANEERSRFPAVAGSGSPLNIVHPDHYIATVNEDRHYGIKSLLRKIPDSVKTTLRWRKAKSQSV
jgi:SAM-dependent methyltransferase